MFENPILTVFLGGELSWSRNAESEEIAKVDWRGLYIWLATLL